MKEVLHNEETIIKIGSNAKENWTLVDSDDNYTWLHLNSYPSCHVVIETDDPTQEEIIFAAQLCKENTKYRNLRNLKICYTTCGNLKKGTETGSVIYKSKRKVHYIVV
jgi:predicted ribosome quality control (RQC) complex YloA/Tae2 family protein